MRLTFRSYALLFGMPIFGILSGAWVVNTFDGFVPLLIWLATYLVISLALQLAFPEIRRASKAFWRRLGRSKED